jgi:uncharacterized protein YkwD
MLRFVAVETRLLTAATLCVVGLLLATIGTGAGASTSDSGSSRARGSSVDTLREVGRRATRLTNQKRRQHDRNRLEPEEGLRRVACHHSHDMLTRGYLRHENPEGESPSDRVARGHRRLIGETGENLWGQRSTRRTSTGALAERIVEQWMASPPHRKNLLRDRFTHVGICVLKKGNTWRGTQVFARIPAYLRTPLPRTARAGGVLVAPIERTGSSTASIAKYDFWDPRTDERIAGPFPFNDTLRLPRTTGPVRPRFYVPQAGRYTLHQGPEIRLTSP